MILAKNALDRIFAILRQEQQGKTYGSITITLQKGVPVALKVERSEKLLQDK